MPDSPLLSTLRSIARVCVRPYRRKTDCFLRRTRGVIHVGGNIGQERDLYAGLGLNVAWIEPIPEIFERLAAHIAPFPKQRALRYLVTDVDGREYNLHVSNFHGVGSSIFDLAGHKKFWPHIDYTGSMTLASVTLSTLAKRERLNMAEYDALVMDTQGSELLILQGAVDLFPHIRYVQSEVADFEGYVGCCRLAEMDVFMRRHGFRRMLTRRFAYKAAVGAYYNVVYRRDLILRGTRRKAA